MELQRNGVKISLDLAGKGNLSFLFIHGVGANRTFFSGMYHHLLKQGRVLNVDLRGHGKSGTSEQPYTIETYAEDLGWLCKQLKLDNIIVIGHSMGGNIALEFNSRHPELVKSLIFLDTWLFWNESALEFFSKRFNELKSPQFLEHLNNLVEMRCAPTDQYIETVRMSFYETPQRVWCSSLENMQKWDMERAKPCVESCRVPVLYISVDKLLVDLDKFHKY